MQLYHYTTWSGEQIAKDGVIKPSDRYGSSKHIFEWPKLVFLTVNPTWEPSVQARSRDGHWEKCGSCVGVYKELGIPCWRFEVACKATPIFNYPKANCRWFGMLGSALMLGSEVYKWFVTEEEVGVKKSWNLS